MPQDGWRWCGNCHGLYYGPAGRVGGGMPGRCTSPESGDRHYHARSANYVLKFEGDGPGQAGWRWCHRCQMLWFAGHGAGRCFAGGEHSKADSGSYVVPVEGQDEGQTGWRWCHKCECLWFVGARIWCPAGGHHETTDSGAYVLENYPPELAWFEAGSGPMSLPTGVSQWYDRREPSTSGTIAYALASTDESERWPRAETVHGHPAVRFGDDLGAPKKGLPIRGPGVSTALPTLSIYGTPYTVIAVVSRTSSRGDNYPVLSAGLDCGAFGCARDSALHLGWQGDRTVRFGQYYNDLDLPDAPPFRPGAPVVSVLSAVSDRSRKVVALDEPGFSRVRTSGEGSLLRTGARPVSIGGPPRHTPPDFHFNGHVFEVVLWDTALTPRQLDRKRELLRARYGIGGAPMEPS